MKEKFDFQARVLMCSNCGGPLETGFAGGTVKCDYCGTVNVFEPRKESPVEPLEVAGEIDEDERMELLRRQDGAQTEIPQALQPLLSDGVLAPWKVEEAMTMWQATCRSLSARDDYTASELLYYLTIILSNHFSGENDALRERAMYESALEVMTLPRHRQIMRGLLARKAALAGDAEAARKWLEPCNPRSRDLESDSSYRVSMAEILTVEKDWKGVLEVLGEDTERIPITSMLDGKAIVQRANALEHLGRLQEAASQLQLFIHANGSSGKRALRSIAAVYTESGIEVCALSLPHAERQHVSQSGRSQSQASNPGGCFGQVFTIAGALMLVLGLGLGLVIDDAPALAGLGPGLAGIVFLVIGVRSMRSGKRVQRLYNNGLEARGTLEAITPTGWKINGIPQYLLQVRVEGDEGSYRASVKKTLGESTKDGFRPGTRIDLLVDPEDPQHVAVVE